MMNLESAFVRDATSLKQLQSLPLESKVVLTQQRIREWYDYFDGDVFVSFSGGKDSTVLAHLVREMYPDVPLVFDNTGLEYPEIQLFARKIGAEIIRPKMGFSEVISTYGYPLVGKEVAEAICTARYIRNASTHTRTMNQKRDELHGNRIENTINYQSWGVQHNRNSQEQNTNGRITNDPSSPG